jgi:hypothetical protein
MSNDKAVQWLIQFLGVGVLMVLFVGLFLLAPVLTLWAVNTFSEQAHWGWHIPHNIWTYLAVYCIGLRNFTQFNSSKKKTA